MRGPTASPLRLWRPAPAAVPGNNPASRSSTDCASRSARGPPATRLRRVDLRRLERAGEVLPRAKVGQHEPGDDFGAGAASAVAFEGRREQQPRGIDELVLGEVRVRAVEADATDVDVVPADDA